MLRSLYLHSYEKQTAPMLTSGTAELAAVQLVLKFLGACWKSYVNLNVQPIL